MSERRPLSLLDLAIAASAGVLPVLVAVVVLVAFVRPADPDAAWRQGLSDRYVSVRHVAALKTFERAIVQRETSSAIHVSAADLLDGVPSCRAEWGGGGWLQTLRHALVRSDASAPAQAIADDLGELDGALLRFSERPERRVAHVVGLDAARWFAAADAALAAPVESSEAPGTTFRLRCADLLGALAALRRADARMLDSLAWRGSEGSATVARWRPDQETQILARDVTRRNPWGGIAGCIYLGSDSGARYYLAAGGSAQRRICSLPALAGTGKPVPLVLGGEPDPAEAVDDPRWKVPPSLFTLLQPLETLRQTTGPMYRRYVDAEAASMDGPLGGRAAPNRAVVDGAPVDVGYSVELTIDPELQALAQKTAACYTGRHDVCQALAMRRAEDAGLPLGRQLLEGAMVRMAAVAVIDVASGRIEALAGALSPCARQEVDRSTRDPSCDSRLPFPVRFRADALLNPAVYHDAMPASTIKPILATEFLADPRSGARLLASEQAAMRTDAVPARESLRGQLMRSDSARFLDRMFCAEQGFADCRRPWDVQATARAFGWNAGCASASEACGQGDLLFGRDLGAAGPTLAPGATRFAFGRLLSEPIDAHLGAPMHLMPSMRLDPEILRRCAAGPDGRRMSDDDWEKCRGGAVVDVVAEGWGQGHARASALGVAAMMATVASTANGAPVVPSPHLVDSVHGVDTAAMDPVRSASQRWAGPPRSPPASQAAAEVILSGLSYSHRAGTARTACEQVLDARRCRDISWIAGKTGTPSFPSDGLSLDAIARLCGNPATAALEARRGICGSLRPYKWYVATYRADRSASGPWTKAIAVLTERNWISASGRVHGAGDTGPNPSAEIALQIVGRRTGLMESVLP